MCDKNKNREAMSEVSPTEANRRLRLEEMTAQDFYFDSGAHWTSHLGLIRSSMRLQMLTKFFTQKDTQGNKLFAGKSILDVSVGCGLVAMLAVKVGEAKQLVAVDRSNILDAAREIFRENSLFKSVYESSKFDVNEDAAVCSGKSEARSESKVDSETTSDARKRRIRSRIDCIKLKTDFEYDAQILRLAMKNLQFDVIMCSRLLFSTTSETDAFDAALLRSLIVARDRFLKPGGVILPAELIFHVVGIENVSYMEEKIDWWKCVHGFDMSAMQQAILKDVGLRSIDGLQAVTRSQTLHTINFLTAQRQHVECFESAFELKMLRFAYVNALAVFTEVVLRFTEKPPEAKPASATSIDSSVLPVNVKQHDNDESASRLVVSQAGDQENSNLIGGESIQPVLVSTNEVSTALPKDDDSPVNDHDRALMAEQSTLDESLTPVSSGDHEEVANKKVAMDEVCTDDSLVTRPLAATTLKQCTSETELSADVANSCAELSQTILSSVSVSSDSNEEVTNKKVAIAQVCSDDSQITRPIAAASCKQCNSETDQLADVANSCAERYQVNSSCNNPTQGSKRRPKRLRPQQKSAKVNGSAKPPTVLAEQSEKETKKVCVPVHEVRWSGEPGNIFGLRQNIFFLRNRYHPRSRPFIVARVFESIKGHFAMKESGATWSSSHVPIDVACQTDNHNMLDTVMTMTDNQGHINEQYNASSRITLSQDFRVEVSFGKSEHAPLRVVSTQTDDDGVYIIAAECECAVGRVCPTRCYFESLREYEMPLTFVFEPTSANNVKSEQLPDYYFDSYASFCVHEVMLRDVTRTMAYRNAVCRNAHLFENKVVLDVGCGTGILSMFAAQTGSKHVIGVDKSNIIEYAHRIVKENQLDSKITLLKGYMEDAQLPPARLNSNGKVDILISEWMGYCLFYEAMLTTVIAARDRWLDTDGRILPDRATLQICGVKGAHRQQYVDAWKDVHGFTMEYMSDLVSKNVLVHSISEDQLVTSSCLLRELDLRTIKADQIPFSASFALRALRRDTLNALCVWFTVDFSRLDWSVVLDTAPNADATHWQHTVFYVEDSNGDPLNVNEGELIEGTFSMDPNSRNRRDLDFDVCLFYRNKTIKKSFRL